MNILSVKMIYNAVFVKRLQYFTLQIYVFMTCSTTYCLCDILMDPWDVSIYVCINVGQVGKEKIPCPSWESNPHRLSYK